MDWILGRSQDRRTPAPRPPGNPYTDSDMQVVGECASRLADVVNESMELATHSMNLETKLSRLGVARVKLDALKEMAQKYPFLVLEALADVEAEVAKLELQFHQRGYYELAAGNADGQRLEKEGRIEEAVAVYETLAERSTDTPFTYRRLAILYRKKKDSSQEARVLRLALKNVLASNATHFAWFENRYKKLLVKTSGSEDSSEWNADHRDSAVHHSAAPLNGNPATSGDIRDFWRRVLVTAGRTIRCPSAPSGSVENSYIKVPNVGGGSTDVGYGVLGIQPHLLSATSFAALSIEDIVGQSRRPLCFDCLCYLSELGVLQPNDRLTRRS